MAGGWSVILEAGQPAAAAAATGRSLLYYQRQIDDLAARLELTPLSVFFSRDPHAIAAYLRDQGIEPDMDALPSEEWFEPADGLASVRGLLGHLRGEPADVPEAARVIADLEVVEAALAVAANQGVRFHLGRELVKPERE